MKTPKQKPLTAEDLKSLVQALGSLVRESVREEVRDALRPLVEQLSRITPKESTNGQEAKSEGEATQPAQNAA